MKVFLSWSGTTSHKIALAFREWLPSVIQSIEPYVSSEDIDKGKRWSSDIAVELENSAYGILCVTKDNINAPWLNFEAGALSKTIDKAFVSPFLFEVKQSEVQGPVLQFQCTKNDKTDIQKLIKSLNKACASNSLSEKMLDTAFEMWYPKLEESLNEIIINIKENINDVSESTEKEITPNEILEELLELSRSNQKLLRNPENEIYEKIEIALMDLKRAQSRVYANTPKKSLNRQLDIIMHSRHNIGEFEEPTELSNLLIITGAYKDQFPWLYDTTNEMIKCLDNDNFKLFERLKQRLEYFSHPMYIEMFIHEIYYYKGQKETEYVYRELIEFLMYAFSKFPY